MNDDNMRISESDQDSPPPKDMRALLHEGGAEAVTRVVEEAEPWGEDDEPEEGEKTPDEHTRPLIELPGVGRPLGQFAGQVGENLKGFYRFDKVPVSVSLDGSELVALEPQAARTSFERYIAFFKQMGTQDAPRRELHSMDIETARGVCASEFFRERLPVVRSVMPTRLPVIRESGKIELLPEGYDLATKHYTNPNGCKYDEGMSIGEALAFIHTLYSEFPFTSKRSLAVAIASALTTYGGGLLPAKSLVPCFIYQANAEGSGKTTLAFLTGAPYGLVSAKSAPSSKAEWDKLLVTETLKGSRFILFDNVKGHLNSPALESYLTSPIFSGRRLGYNDLVEGDADAVVIITANDLTITADMRRRSLFVELFMNLLKAEDRKFTRRLDPPAILAAQPKILAALYALVRHWDEKGRPKGSIVNGSFPAWSEIIGGIVEAAGFECPTQHADLASGGDTDTQDMQALGELMQPNKDYQFKDLEKFCMKEGLFERFTTELDFEGKLASKGKAGLSKIFLRFDKRQMAEGKVLTSSGKAHSKRYRMMPNADQVGTAAP